MVRLKTLAFGHAADNTFRYLITQAHSRGCSVQAIDLVHLALRGKVYPDLSNPMQSSICIGKQQFHLGDYEAIIARFLDVSAGAPIESMAMHYRRVLSEVCQVVERVDEMGLAPVVNPPCSDRSNFTKLFHGLLLNEWTGIDIPPSCLSNDPYELKEFFYQHVGSGVITKGVSASKTWATEVRESDLLRISSVRTCPVLLQQRIKGGDLRIHVAGDEAFGEKIESDRVDYRRQGSLSSYSTFLIPDGLRASCLSIRNRMGLPLVGVDFKIEDATGRYYLLEANAMPCYQGYDRRARGAISDAIVRFLRG
ncbi:RimK family alpha-L-glutamate ligase [Streptomyces sp. NPDC051554]|uniref:RimK family alpha-L-glutamate ligase n=1 Tax=Streptomyces sp. NPDC051554 TaxID=3365656 RepID=UPI003788C29F